MLRELKLWILAALTLLAVNGALAFSLEGPLAGAPYQVPTIGYQLRDDITTPRNIGEEFRWNMPVLYYSFDQNFLNYFGSNGVVAVQQGMGILNTSITNLSANYANQFGNFAYRSGRVNDAAVALSLYDLKSEAIRAVLEELGEDDSIRWVWCLRGRQQTPNTTCPVGVQYEVIQRNFDPVTFNPTAYINGTLMTYEIFENCTGNPEPESATINFQVDPEALVETARDGAGLGGYLTGLTVDDIGELAYAMGTNTAIVETIDPSATLLSSTNTGGGGGGGSGSGTVLELLTTSNLADLVQESYTNPPATLSNLFPGLVINSYTTAFGLVVTSNVFAYFTNDPYAPAGTFFLRTGITYTTNIEQIYNYNFGNVVTLTSNALSYVTTTITNITNSPYAPAGSPAVTNITTTTVKGHLISGDYYLVPPNNCGFQVLSNVLSQVIPSSTTVSATNTFFVNGVPASYSITTTTYFTNHNLAVLVTPCSTNSTGGGGGTTNAAPELLRQGINGIQFIQASMDPVTGLLYTPQTNFYTMVAISNSVPIVENFRRVATAPDIIFSGQDLDPASLSQYPWVHDTYVRTIAVTPGWTETTPGNGLFGPGLISPQKTIGFTTVGPELENLSPFFVNQLTASTNVQLGSFDGTTNAPVLYPSGASIQNLENEMLLSISPSTLPDATNGVAYSQQLTAIGAQSPYVFSLAAGSPSLPVPLTLSPSGLISGTITNASSEGTYDFNVQLTDAENRTVDVPYNLTVTNTVVTP